MNSGAPIGVGWNDGLEGELLRRKDLKVKVYGGLTFVAGRQVRTIVAAKSMKQAAELTGEKYSYIREYWCETGNDIELQIANSQPGVVFVASSTMGKDFVPSNAD